MNNAIEISPYDANDESEVIALWNACGLITPANDPQMDINRKLEVDRDLFLVGRNKSAVVATVMGGYEGHRGWINYLAVAPGERRQGYGQKMMAAVEGLIEKKAALRSIYKFVRPMKTSSSFIKRSVIELMMSSDWLSA